MSRFWEKIVRVDLPFNGSPEQTKLNVESHRWGTVDKLPDWVTYEEADRPVDLSAWPLVCLDCRVVASSRQATWPCGQAPESVTLWDHLKKAGK